MYFRRTVYTLNFDLNQFGTRDGGWGTQYRNHVASLTIGGVAYTDSTGYSIQAKYEQYIGDQWPTSPNEPTQTADIWSSWGGWHDTGDDLAYDFEGWDPPDSIYQGLWVTKRLVLTTDMIPSSGTSVNISATWNQDLMLKSVNYWLERLPGQTGETRTYGGKTYVKSTEYSQQFYTQRTSGLSPKAIEGVTFVGEANEGWISTGFGNGVWTNYNFFYDRNRLDLDFNSMGGSSVESRNNIMYGRSLASMAPSDPTRANYEFDGWYLDAGYYMPFNFSTATMPDSDLMLFAKWESTQYHARFFDNLGGTMLDEQGVAEDEYVSDPGLYVVGQLYEGFGIFRGWYWYLPAPRAS